MMKRCFLTGEYVFYATSRANRPHSYKKTNTVRTTPKQYCPFCLENQDMTPPLIYATEDNSIRIVPNKYPFIECNSEHYGVHDVVIDTACHDESLHEFSDDHIYKLMSVLKNRFIQFEHNEECKFVQIFKNQGVDAGASQSHSHWQITALCVVPPKMEHLCQVLGDYYKENNKCYYCNLDFGDRVVEESQYFRAYTPADAKFAYEMDILPKRHISSFKDFTDDELKDFGVILKHSVKRLNKLYEGLCYNICFYSAPKNGNEDKHFHFYAQIFPRIGHMAGFEFSTGCYINSVLPSVGAARLREVDINE